MDNYWIVLFIVLLLIVGVAYYEEANKHSERTFEVTEHELIRVTTPKSGDEITSPLVIKGEAVGPWFFEASFPIILTDWDGRIIAEHFATAQGSWMTTDFVPFEATIEFERPEYGERGTLILQKDNPSDLRELDDAHEITIFYK